MKQEREFPAAVISRKAETALRAGHTWVYDAEIRSLEGSPENGGLIDVRSEKGAYLGTGFLSETSKIRIRVLSTNANERFGDEFFGRRVRYAVDYRETVMGADFSCCRLVFGEADGLPGLTVDRYGDVLVSEVLSFGTERVKDIIYRALCDRLLESGVTVRGIFERNVSPIRALEGLKAEKGWYKGDFVQKPASSIVEITENGIIYRVDVENGQKTGFFLDQKYNRLAVANISKGKKVLDCFAHTGSFALNAVKGGAQHVTVVEASTQAVEMAKLNAKRNGMEEKMDFLCADVFELLPELCEKDAGYDVVILDPPAFARSRRTVSSAEKGYKEINYRAMRLLPRGGYLATCSCSHYMENALFKNMLLAAARDAGVSLRLVEERRAAPDHPVLMQVPETDYLKFYLLQIV